MTTAVLDCMASHRSVRDFTAEPLGHGCLEEAVRAAEMASTSSHAQAYSIIRVTDESTRARLAEIAGGQRMVSAAPEFLVVCADIRRHLLVSRRAGRPHEQNFETFLTAIIDASLFAQNLALALESMGFGICFVGALRNNLDDVDRVLELPAGVLPLYGMCAGRPRSSGRRKPRLPVKAVLFDGRYPSDAAILSHIDAYDETIRAYNAERHMPDRDWSSGIIGRHESKRRIALAEYYARKGARLD